MADRIKISTADELEFVIFCIENIALRLNKNPADVFNALTEKSYILNSYIVPEYEVLHTQSKEYIVDELVELLDRKGITI